MKTITTFCGQDTYNIELNQNDTLCGKNDNSLSKDGFEMDKIIFLKAFQLMIMRSLWKFLQKVFKK